MMNSLTKELAKKIHRLYEDGKISIKDYNEMLDMLVNITKGSAS